MAKSRKVMIEYVRGGKRETMGEGFANVLEKIGLVTRVDSVQPEKKKRGRPKKTTEVEPVPGTYKRRDLRPED